MYKSKLQELCQKKKWDLPVYSCTRDGPNHNARYTAFVSVNGIPFASPNVWKSSKVAQNDAAQLAFDTLMVSTEPNAGGSKIQVTYQSSKDHSNALIDKNGLMATNGGFGGASGGDDGIDHGRHSPPQKEKATRVEKGKAVMTGPVIDEAPVVELPFKEDDEEPVLDEMAGEGTAPTGRRVRAQRPVPTLSHGAGHREPTPDEGVTNKPLLRNLSRHPSIYLQVVGEVNAIKTAIEKISSCLREWKKMCENNSPHRGLVFRILCPIDKVDHVVGNSNRIIKLLEDEIGVDVEVTDPITGSNERTIIISSEEGPDNELFPAQEALLRIQTRIVDLVPDKDNIITTRLLVLSSEIGCLEGALAEMRIITGADIQILPREQLPIFMSGTDELVQIVGERKAVRDALLEVMSRLRRYLYGEFFPKDMPPPPISAVSPVGSALGPKAPSPNNITPAREGQIGSDQPTASYQNVAAVEIAQPSKLSRDDLSSNFEDCSRQTWELRDTKESLRATNEKLLASNEELGEVKDELSNVKDELSTVKSQVAMILSGMNFRLPNVVGGPFETLREVPKDVTNVSATLPNTGVHSISASRANTSNGDIESGRIERVQIIEEDVKYKSHERQQIKASLLGYFENGDDCWLLPQLQTYVRHASVSGL